MKISERGQITIPKRLRDRLGMNHNVEVEVVLAEGGLLIRKRTEADHPIDSVYGLLRRVSHPGIPIVDTDSYLEEIRGR